MQDCPKVAAKAVIDCQIRGVDWILTKELKRPSLYRSGYLTTELRSQGVVGAIGFEPTTPTM